MTHVHPGDCTGEGCGRCKFVAVGGPMRDHFGVTEEQANAWIAETLWVQKWIREQPSLLARVTNFGKAFFNHALAGFVKREQAEVDRIFEICKGCEMYNGETCTHPRCGCNISRDGGAFLNKLSWKSETCPIGKW